jgi:hypothetical protein
LRIYCGLILGVTVFLGFFSRGHPMGWYAWDKSLGDALAAFAVYVGIVLLGPRLRPGVALMLAAGVCAGVESFKLTGLPAAWQSHAVSRLTLGTTPSVHNLICYSMALAVAGACHWMYRRAGGSKIQTGS